MVLHWLRENENYKIFLANALKKILNKEFTEWKYALIKENLEDIESRDCTLGKCGKFCGKVRTGYITSLNGQISPIYTSKLQQETKLQSS